MADSDDPFAKFAAATPQSDESDPFAKYAMRTPNAETPAPSATAPMTWGDVGSQAVQNFGPSLVHTGEAIAQPFLHPIDTAQSLYDVGKGAVSKAASAVGIQQDPEQKAQREAAINAVGQFFSDRYGSVEGFKHALANDPAGVALDLSTVVTGPASAAARAPGIVGKAGSIARAADTVLDPVLAAGTAATKVAEPVVSTILGRTTGVGADPIRAAGRAGLQGNQAFVSNMRGTAPMSDVVDMAKSAVGEMGKERGAAYQAGMTGVNADKTVLSLAPVKQAISSADAMINKVGPTGKIFVKDQEAADRLAEMQKIIADHEAAYPNPTAADLDDLKQSLYEVQRRTDPGTLARKVTGNIYNSAKDTITKQAPNYADTMKSYADASNQIKEVTKTFSLGEKASQDTALRKLQSTMRNNVNTNYGQRTLLMDELAKYEPDLPYALAGQSMNSAGPRGLSALGALELGGAGGLGYLASGNPMAAVGGLASLPAFSPRLVGEAAYHAGRGVGALKSLPGAGQVSLRPVSTAAKGAYQTGRAAGISGGIGPRYDQFGNLIANQ